MKFKDLKKGRQYREKYTSIVRTFSSLTLTKKYADFRCKEGHLLSFLEEEIHDWELCESVEEEYLRTVDTSTLDVQVGGDHYKKLKIQPWEIIRANDLDFFQGNVVKYVMRYKTKNGLEDLKKCLHYLENIIENEESNETK